MILNENIQQARKILKDVNKNTSNKDFLKIKKLTSSTPGYLGFFTKHYFKKGATLDNIEYVLNLLRNNKELLNKLDKQVVEYEDLEELDDDLTTLIDFKIYNKELVTKMNSKFKKVAKNDDELKTFWINLSETDKKEVLLLMGTISFYEDYDDFKNVLVNGIGDDIDEVVENINSTNNAYLIHNSNGIIIAEIYNKEASIKLGSKAWCISREVNNAWYVYNDIFNKTKQYFVWNFRVPAYDIDSMMGTTIDSNGNPSYSHLKNDDSVLFNNYIKKYEIDKKHFKPLNPKEDVGKIIKANDKTFKLGKFLKNNEVFKKYRLSFPMSVLISLREVTKEEIKSSEYAKQINKFKLEMLTDPDSQYIKDIFGFVEDRKIGDYDDVETFYTKNNNSEYIDILKELDFVDRLYLCNKFSASEEEFETIMFFDEYNEAIEVNSTYSGLELVLDENNDVSPFAYYYDVIGIDGETYDDFSYYDSYIEVEDEEVFRFFDILDDVNKNSIKNYLKKISKDFNIPALKSYSQKIVDVINSEKKYDEEEEALRYMCEVSKVFEDIIEKIKETLITNTEENSTEDYETFKDSLYGEYDDNNNIWRIVLEDFYMLISKKGIISGTFDEVITQQINDISNNTYNFMGDYPFRVFSYDISQEYVEKCNDDILEILYDYEDDYEHYKLTKIENLIRNGFKQVESTRNRFYRNQLLYRKASGVIYFLDDRTIDNSYEQSINIKIHKGTLKEILDNPNDDYKSYEMRLISNKEEVEFKDPNQLEFQFEHLKTFKGFKLM